MDLVGAISAAVSAAAGVVRTVYQAKSVSDLKKFAVTVNVEDSPDPRIINDAVGVLISHFKDLEIEVKSNKRKAEYMMSPEWVNRVNEVTAECCQMNKDESYWHSLDSDSREQRKNLYKKLKNLLEEISQTMVDPPLERVVKSCGAPDISKFGTLQEPLKQILNLLEIDEVKRIGIYGTVGIGKTTILRNLNNHEQVAKNFDIVIWLKVSKEESKENLSRKDLQQDIVQRLKLNMGGTDSADEVAERILMELKSKRYLLLLDDVKKYLVLNEIGIPPSNNGSKIVLTTRLLDVCPEMVDMVIKVNCLSYGEAWRMFQDVLRMPELNEDKKLRRVAQRLCKDCGGLPLVIEKVASTFKWKAKESLWGDGLNSWRTWVKREGQGIREMYELLKQFCYDNLDDDPCKNCFLYGALYPEDMDINKNDLLECWEANNLLVNGKSMTNGNSILDYLHELSILEEGKNKDHVKMHKFIRQVAVYITEDYPEHKYLVKASRELRKPPDEELWGAQSRISLGDNELDELTFSPVCPMLSTLFLQKNLRLMRIPDSFFQNMEKLGVLDLSYTGIISLPSSISSLDRLKILYLIHCKHLEKLPPEIDGLKQLEALDIRGSAVNNIPPHIEKLVHLRRLRVSFTQKALFNYKIIPELKELEEFVIDWSSSEQLTDEVVENITKEVATLQQFKILKVCFSNKVVVLIEVKSDESLRIRSPETVINLWLKEKSSRRNVQHISSFDFYIGCQNSEDSQFPKFRKYGKYIKYCNGASGSFPIPEALAEADAFELVNHKYIKQLSDFETTGMNKVQGCLIESCDEIETIVGAVNSIVLANLEHLYMKNLPKLESIWKDPVQPGSLTKLTILDLTSCQMLVKIFPPGVIQQLHQIQHLKIEKCQEIEEIIAESDTVGNLNVLPKLKELILLDMQRLRLVCESKSLEWGSLEKLEIFKCPGLRQLPFNKDKATKLETIEAEQQWWEALQWQDDEVEVKERLQKLCVLS